MRADKQSCYIPGGSHSLTLIREGGSECEAFACASSSALSIDVCIFPIFILAVMSAIASACDEIETINGAILGLALTLIDCREDWCANVEGTASFPLCDSSAMVFEWVSVSDSKDGLRRIFRTLWMSRSCSSSSRSFRAANTTPSRS